MSVYLKYKLGLISDDLTGIASRVAARRGDNLIDPPIIASADHLRFNTLEEMNEHNRKAIAEINRLLTEGN